MELAGVPSVVLVTAAFEAGARATATARGFAELPIVTFAADFEERPVVDQHREFAARAAEIVRGLHRG